MVSGRRISPLRGHPAYNFLVVVLAVFASVLVVGCQAGATESYPSKEINMIVPFDAGGPSDRTARFVADMLQKELGQPIVIVNRPGAGSAVGLQELARSKADGYTIGLATSSLISNKHIGSAPVDYTQLTPIAQMVTSPGSLAVKADAPYSNLKELISEAKNNPAKVRVGNTGTGATWHLMMVMLEDASNAQFADIPYDGGADIVAALLGGHIEAGAQSESGFTPNVKGGKLKFLGISADQRDNERFPDVPTFKEQGIDVVYGLWTGFLAPKGIPDASLQKLSTAFEKIAKSKEFADFAGKEGFNLAYKSPADFTQFLKAEDERISDLAKKYDFNTKK